MSGYSSRDVAKMLDLSIGQVRSYARAGLLHPDRGPRGEYRFTFQDLVLLRTAKGLLASRIPPRRVKQALSNLRDQVPTGRPLSGVQVVAEGDQIMARHGAAVWDTESGQAQFNFETSELDEKVRPHARHPVMQAEGSEDDLNAEDWFILGSDLETAAPEQARETYRRTLELNPRHVDARINLGRLLHEVGQVHAAEAHYRLALGMEPKHATGLFNLGVALEDQGRDEEAVQTYRLAIEHGPECADAYYNVARLLEKMGDSKSALRYLSTYRKLTDT